MTCKTLLGVLGAALFSVSQLAPVVAQDDKSGNTKKTILVEADFSDGTGCRDATDHAC